MRFMNLRLKNWRHKDSRKINREVIAAYGEKLESQGWVYSISSGGYISPDRSAIFYTSRTPYNGLVMKNSMNGDYRSVIETLYKTGNFKFI